MKLFVVGVGALHPRTEGSHPGGIRTVDSSGAPASRGLSVRDIVLGLSDGLTVPFALAAGVSGAVHSNVVVVIAGFSELAAGAISMGLGGFLAGVSDLEVYHRAKAQEHREVLEVPEEERQEVEDILKTYGLRGPTLKQALDALTANQETWVRFMMREELGLEEPHPSHGLQSGLTIGLSYVAGGIVPLLPYLLPLKTNTALLVSAIVTLLILALFGWFKGRLTGNAGLRPIVQTVLIGSVAAAVSYVIARSIAGWH